MALFSNQTIVITGASGGVGQAIAQALSEKGAIVCLSGRNRERLNEVAARSDKGRSWLPQEEGRPSNFVAGIAEACVRKSSRWGSALVGRERTANPSSEINRFEPGLFSQLLNIYQEDLNHPPSLNDRPRSQPTWRLYRRLDSERFTCIFFEMPIDSSLAMDMQCISWSNDNPGQYRTRLSIPSGPQLGSKPRGRKRLGEKKSVTGNSWLVDIGDPAYPILRSILK